ncbi:hypothetical protein Vretimale_12751, partial [Volvox reticuliferus]
RHWRAASGAALRGDGGVSEWVPCAGKPWSGPLPPIHTHTRIICRSPPCRRSVLTMRRCSVAQAGRQAGSAVRAMTQSAAAFSFPSSREIYVGTCSPLFFLSSCLPACPPAAHSVCLSVRLITWPPSAYLSSGASAGYNKCEQYGNNSTEV